jgi:uncharacterized phage protein (TIGR02220 family)
LSENINEKDRIFVHKVVEHLNLMAGSTFDPNTSMTIQYILERKNEGFSFLDFKTVIDRKCKEWLNTNMQPNIRPLTLFSQRNFENYLNSPNAPDTKSKSKSAYDSAKRAIDRTESFDWGLGEE